MPGGAMMDWRDQWDFEEAFTPAQAALLIEGKNPEMYSISAGDLCRMELSLQSESRR
jgi:hypothetical protein